MVILYIRLRYQFAVKEWMEVVLGGIIRAMLEIDGLRRLALEGILDEFERIFGIRPKDSQEALSLVESMETLARGRQHVKPDILIFEGDYRSRKDLTDNLPNNIILIDAKINITDSDLKQLKSYRDVFNREFKKGRMHYVVASLERAKQLGKLGFIVVENVAPGKEGEVKFVETIRNIISAAFCKSGM